MTGPPKGKGARQSASSSHQNYDAETVAHGKTSDNLFPTNVELLNAAGAGFHWRKSAGDLIGSCPLCRGKLILHESEPWALCVGETYCRASTMPFDELLAAIRGTA